jgi:hypothetical protein
MSISGLRKASWYNPDTGRVVQANDIAEDGEFYTRAIEDPDDQTPTGESPYAGDESYCELMVFDMSLLPQLKAWQESDTRISMVAAGVQQNIQWYERDLVNVKPVYPVAAGRRNHINVVMERTGHGAHDIYGHVNLLAHLGTTADPWTDSDRDGVPDGYETYEIEDISFGNTVTIKNNAGQGILIARILFPIERIYLTYSLRVVSIISGNPESDIRHRDYKFNLIKRNSVDLEEGRVSSSILTEPNYYRVKWNIVSDDSAYSISINNPSLRVDGSNKYVSY